MPERKINDKMKQKWKVYDPYVSSTRISSAKSPERGLSKATSATWQTVLKRQPFPETPKLSSAVSMTL